MNKIKEILIGTNNVGKYKEIRSLLPKKVKKYSLKEFNIKSPKETGKTFKQNSFIKASHFSKKTNLICLSDDSGLEIKILKGAPGIYSSRWGGKKSNFNLAIKKVFKKLDQVDKNWKIKKIRARFICALTIYGSQIKTIQSTGKIEGKISNYKKGSNGFGYDPIFIPNGKKITFGQMKSYQKYKIDHRAKAFKNIKIFL